MSTSFIPSSVSRLEQEVADLEKEGGSTPVVEENEEEVESSVAEKIEPVLDAEELTWKKRFGDLRTLQQKTAQKVKELEAKQSSPKTTIPNPADLEEITAWAEANPKAAAVIRALAGEQVKTSTEVFTPKFEDLDELKAELARTKAEKVIIKVHPDFLDVTSTDKFHDWAQEQVQSVQDIIYDGSAEEVIWALTAYKKYAEEKSSDPKRDAALTVKGKTTKIEPKNTVGEGRFSESQVKSMSLAEYEKNEPKIAESMSNGSFIYDLSGGAR